MQDYTKPAFDIDEEDISFYNTSKIAETTRNR